MSLNILETIKLDKDDLVPLYSQLERQIESAIEEAALCPGDRLPDGDALSRALGINSNTCNKALNNLVKKGLLTRRRRAGTFVKEHARAVSTVGFFYLHEAEVFMSRVSEYIQRYCSRHDHDLKAVSFDWDYYSKIDLREELQRRDLKGAIITTIGTEDCRQALHRLEASGFPHVRFGNAIFSSELHAPLVRGDDAGKTRQVMEYLWHRGHRKIGLVYYEAGSDVEREYLKFYAEKGGFADRWLMMVRFSGPPEKWQGFPVEGMDTEYLQRNQDMTAVIVESTPPCVAMMRRASQLGKSVPADLSFVCLSDWPGLELLDPPLTAVRAPRKAMAEKACEILFDVIENGNSHEGRIEQLRYQLVERGSVAELVEDAAPADTLEACIVGK
jgi:DNA-binding LacI/PurR family transcriptional regulator